MTTEEYLGHVINENGVRPDMKKMIAVKNSSIPKSQTNIRQFLGLAGYYRRFIKGFSATAKPLSDLLKKNTPYDWKDGQAIVRLQKVKSLDLIPPNLFYPTKLRDPEPKIEITLVNNSITHTKDNILPFTSSDCEFTRPVDKLLLDIGRINKNNIKLAKPKKSEIIVTSTPKYKTVSAILMNKRYEEFTVQDLQRTLRNVADTINKYLCMSRNNLTDKIPSSTFLDTLKEALQNCECEISVCYGSTTIPPDDIRNKIIEENHDSVIGGHRGITKTYRRIEKNTSGKE